MGSKAFVGGLSYATNESQLEELFMPHGTVECVKIVTDRLTGQSHGFGFVEMAADDEANQAIAALKGTQVEGRVLNVAAAKPDQARSDGRGFGEDGGDRGRW